MSASDRFTKEKILEGIKDSRGITYVVAKRLKCDWMTAKKYINKWEITKQAFESEKQTMLDMAESVLFKSINEGNSQDAKWLLSVLGKDRGYNIRQELQHSGEIDTVLKIELVRPSHENTDTGSV